MEPEHHKIYISSNQQSMMQDERQLQQPSILHLKPRPPSPKQILYNNKKCKQIYQQKQSTFSIVQLLQDQQMNEKTFKSCWNIMVNIVSPYVYFNNYIPMTVSQQGRRIVSDSKFLLHWLKVMKMCPYVSMSMLVQYVIGKYRESFENCQQLQIFCRELNMVGLNYKNAQNIFQYKNYCMQLKRNTQQRPQQQISPLFQLQGGGGYKCQRIQQQSTIYQTQMQIEQF